MPSFKPNLLFLVLCFNGVFFVLQYVFYKFVLCCFMLSIFLSCYMVCQYYTACSY